MFFPQVGTPICIPQKDFIDIGRIASIENNHKPVDIAKKGQKVAIKVYCSFFRFWLEYLSPEFLFEWREKE